MSEVCLVVRDADCDWSGWIHGSCADRAIAALSADPVTLDEFERATSRFAKPDPKRRFFANLRSGLNDEPYDAGLVVIDLVARLVFADSTYSSPSRDGYVDYHNGICCTKNSIRYHLADDWLLVSTGNEWRYLAEMRRQERSEKPIIDARAVFYGLPMLEFIARGAVAAFARREEIAHADRKQWDEDAIRQIHRDWLMTPRDDLGGAYPREIALERRGHITWDLQDRSEQWSLMDACPRWLEKSSHAFRYGGFGIHELVVYYYLIREMLASCWGHLDELNPSSKQLSVSDFLATEVPRLEKVLGEWLDAPNREFSGHIPRSIIDHERARLPEGTTGREAVHDPDCPCCQMMADMPGPWFWHLDGCNMDDEFAFDISHRTREEWEKEQQEREEFNRRFNAEWAERERLGVTDSSAGSIWPRNASLDDMTEVPLGIRIFGIGCRLAEPIAGLRGDAAREATPPEVQHTIDQLNRDFGNLRELLQNSEVSLAAALIDPVLDRFTETLATVAQSHPDLEERCEALTEELRNLLEPPPLISKDDSEESDDFGLPF